jgi:hypothetical protein
MESPAFLFDSLSFSLLLLVLLSLLIQHSLSAVVTAVAEVDPTVAAAEVFTAVEVAEDFVAAARDLSAAEAVHAPSAAVVRDRSVEADSTAVDLVVRPRGRLEAIHPAEDLAPRIAVSVPTERVVVSVPRAIVPRLARVPQALTVSGIRSDVPAASQI